MTILDNTFLDMSLKNGANKSIKCHENKDMLMQLSYNNNALFNYFAIHCSSYEAALIIKANNKYIKSKTQSPNKIRYEKRQLIMVELGLNYNKLSYKHPCVVLEDLGDRVFVVPCTSGKAPTFKQKPNPETGVEGEEEIRKGYLEGNESDGFHHLTTIIIKEATCIDKGQIVSTIKEKGKSKKITSDMFKVIHANLHKMLFKWQDFNINKIETELHKTKSELEKAHNDFELIKEQNLKLLKELEQLKQEKEELLEKVPM